MGDFYLFDVFVSSSSLLGERLVHSDLRIGNLSLESVNRIHLSSGYYANVYVSGLHLILFHLIYSHPWKLKRGPKLIVISN